ncbi:MAG TPA: DUF4190 domain-containing protein [Candidatus Angelobacter sp.]|nr:DUF4190 domain-containing protein [Candidatus Angelobacter sp.]
MNTVASIRPAQVNPSATVVSGPQAGPVPAQTEDKAVISLVLGILSIVSLSILAGIPAIILGRMSKRNIRASAGQLGGDGLATAGIVMGWISVVLAVVFLLVIILMLAYLTPARH